MIYLSCFLINYYFELNIVFKKKITFFWSIIIWRISHDHDFITVLLVSEIQDAGEIDPTKITKGSRKQAVEVISAAVGVIFVAPVLSIDYNIINPLVFIYSYLLLFYFVYPKISFGDTMES